MPNKYPTMTTEDFDRLLAERIDDDNRTASQLLSVPGVYELLSEHYNNAVCDAWELEQATADEAQQDEDR